MIWMLNRPSTNEEQRSSYGLDVTLRKVQRNPGMPQQIIFLAEWSSFCVRPRRYISLIHLQLTCCPIWLEKKFRVSFLRLFHSWIVPALLELPRKLLIIYDLQRDWSVCSCCSFPHFPRLPFKLILLPFRSSTTTCARSGTSFSASRSATTPRNCSSASKTRERQRKRPWPLFASQHCHRS